MRALTVGVVASPRRWRSDLQSYVTNHVAGIRLRVLREPQAAAEDHLDVLVVDDVTSFLTRSLLRVLRQQNVRVVGVYDADAEDGFGQRYLEDLGVDLTIAASVSADELVRTIETFAPSLDADGDLADLMAATFDDTPAGHGTVTAVAGPPGAPGATEVAIALAAALTRSGETTVLIEVDEVAPSIAARLLFELEPNLLTALDDVHHGTATLEGALGVRMAGAGATLPFATVPGLAMVADWPLVRGEELSVLIDELSARFGHVVVATGSLLEDLGVPERFGATRAALMCAHAVLAVCSPSPVGVLRFLEWRAEVRQLVPDKPVSVAVNRAPSSSFRRAQLEGEIRENAAPELLGHLAFLPEDGKVALAAWDGSPVSSGPFTRGVDDLARRMFPAAQRSRRRWARRAS